MKRYVFIFVLLPVLYFSQDIRFSYEYEYISDTLKKDLTSQEITVLDFYSDEQRSVYTGLKHIISDSTMAEDIKTGKMTFPDISTKVRYVVEKKDNWNEMYYYTPNHMPQEVFKVKDDRKINWEILGEHDTILGYPVQKATTIFGGRRWTAWFTSEIPIPDGPYKFYGLPGIILNIYDKTHTHSFKITSIEPLKSNYYVLNDPTYRKTKLITLKEYAELPSAAEAFKMKALSGDVIFRDDEHRRTFIKGIDEDIKKEKIHNNNPIEMKITR